MAPTGASAVPLNSKVQGAMSFKNLSTRRWWASILTPALLLLAFLPALPAYASGPHPPLDERYLNAQTPHPLAIVGAKKLTDETASLPLAELLTVADKGPGRLATERLFVGARPLAAKAEKRSNGSRAPPLHSSQA